MSLRKEQCKKVCRILDDVLSNRPTERDSLIVAVREAFKALAEPKRGRWTLKSYRWECDQCGCLIRRENPFKGNEWNYNYCPNCGADMRPLPEPYKEVTE